jgi:O-antigen ligase
MVLLGAIDVLLSGRDLSQTYAELAGAVESTRHPAMAWIQRGMSLVLVVICFDFIGSHLREREPVPSTTLLAAFVLYWVGTVAVPSFFGAHPLLSHEFLYALVIGVAILLVTTRDISRIVDGARTALFLLMLVSVALVPIVPTMVLDESYRQGLLPGVPRLGGIAPHPVALGMFAQTALLLLWARPYANRGVNVLAWILGLSVLFFAQSKTAWIAFILCSAAMFLIRCGPAMWRRLGDPREGSFGIGVCLAAMAFAGALLILLLFADVGGQLADFLDTSQGAQLTSLTGRDQIWAVAIEEWQQHKVFGYGPTLWDDEFRLSIGLPNATSAHNQFMDTIARAGTVGAIALVIYALVLTYFSFRHAKRTGGLSVALYIALALRCVSEVPLLLFGYGTELFIHLLLVVVLASASSMLVPVPRARTRPVYGVPA